jgi:hypothetical protein
MNDKCAYRYRVEEYEGANEVVPEILKEGEYCNGYPKKGCVQYTTLEHLLDFESLSLNPVLPGGTDYSN